MPKTIIGQVVSDKTDKTITVITHTRKTHPIYKKQYSVSKKFMAHDENNEAKEGDKVAIIETRPISARKRFKLSEILEKAVLSNDVLAATKDTDSAARPKSKSKSDDKEDNGEKK